MLWGESSGFEPMPGLFRKNIAVEDSRRFCGAGTGGSGRQKAFTPGPEASLHRPEEKKIHFRSSRSVRALDGTG